MALTLDDLAALSGVSRATVSRVINGGSVAPSTREKVAEVLQRTGYRPNLAARSLASGRSGVIGVVMHLDPPLLFGHPYFSGLLQGMSNVLTEHATGMMLWLRNRSKPEMLDDILRMGLIDGLLVTAHWQADPLVEGLLASAIPTVLIGHHQEDPGASYVGVDHTAGAAEVTRHLLAIGRRRIGHITGVAGSVSGRDRAIGHHQATAAAGLADPDLVVAGDFNPPSGREAAEILIDRSVDAIFCANDATAIGALEAIRARGLRVPEDIAVAGFDDLDFAATMDPPLTTIRQQVTEQGEEAGRALLGLIADPDSGPRRVLLPTTLMVRESTIGASR
ncbi:MAG TPA: LacI family DNA-binding transcriptional regulator [Euzebya sp.]|nr:LacI family DNA-binding transcriptional regulator [Euzebya sp.]